MTTRREIVRAGAGLAAIIAAGNAPAALLRSMLGMRNAMTARSPEYWGLCFTAEEAGSTVRLTQTGTPSPITLQTSADGKTWTDYAVGDTITLANAGDKVYFAAGPDGNKRFSSNGYNYYRFLMSGRVAASGSVMSLLDQVVSPDEVPSYCYYMMFYNCQSLTAAPQLPATKLKNGCYYMMFYGCTSLTAAPQLPATALVDYCYYRMFYGCTKINSVRVAFSAWGPSGVKDPTSDWMNGAGTQAADEKTFYCPSALPDEPRGASTIPEGWTVVRTDAA